MKKTKKAIEVSTNQGMLFVQPYLAMCLVGLLGTVLWFIGLRTNYTFEISTSLIISTLILSGFTWKVSQDRRDIGRIHSLLSMIFAGAFITAEVIIGPNPTLFLIWLLGGLTIGASWNIKHAIRAEPREDPMSKFFTDEGMPGTKWKITKKSKDIVEGVIRLKRGSGTLDQLQKLQPKLASLHGVPPNGIRINGDPEDASQASMKIVRRDMLKEVIKYDYKNEILSPNDQFVIGIYEDGEPEKLNLHSESIGAIHMLIQGQNGSGKSLAAKVIFAECFKMQEAELWVIDATKGEQTLGVIKKYLDWVITDEKIADLLFKKFPKIVKIRADFLGKKHLDKWEPGCGLSFIYLHVEEASGLIANNPDFIKMMETARSVGIAITASLQRASYVAIDTAARAQFSAVMCFGVQDISDAAFALPDEVIDAGANPAIWKNRKQGYNYLVHPDVDQEKSPTPARTMKIENNALDEAGRNRLKRELDSVTLTAVGDLYQAELDDDPDNDEEELDELYPEEERLEVQEDMQELEELKSAHDTYLEFDKPMKMSADEARNILEEHLSNLREEATQFEAPQLANVLIVTGLSRAWLYKQLQMKVEQGLLQKVDATYRFPPKLRKANV